MLDNQEELFPICDEEGRVVGKISRGEAHCGTKILHPVVHLHVFNSKGELYLQHRPKWKDIQPDKWDTACGGHVDYGETVEEALKREVREELGMTDYEPKFLTRYVFEGPRERELVNVYTTIYDGEVCPSEELDGGKFFSRQEILDNLTTGLFTPNFVDEYQKLFAKKS
ncbi:MAG: NUDIX domain-containing protein [Bacteroidaceae bacterium]|nr:NUDIX domain-containing protein [Bacteroidaceae bacterium]